MAQLFFRPKNILVPVRGYRADVEAFRLACGLGHEAKSKLYALYVIEVKRELPVDAEVTSEVGKGEEILSEIETVSREEKAVVSAEILQARQENPENYYYIKGMVAELLHATSSSTLFISVRS